jgi:hypothetical protein
MSVNYIGQGGFGRELSPGRIITIQNGNLVSVSKNVECTSNCTAKSLEEFQNFTIDGLFNWAFRCFVGCIIEYDPTYGYPNRVGVFFFEGGWVNVSNFQSINANR